MLRLVIRQMADRLLCLKVFFSLQGHFCLLAFYHHIFILNDLCCSFLPIMKRQLSFFFIYLFMVYYYYYLVTQTRKERSLLLVDSSSGSGGGRSHEQGTPPTFPVSVAEAQLFGPLLLPVRVPVSRMLQSEAPSGSSLNSLET